MPRSLDRPGQPAPARLRAAFQALAPLPAAEWRHLEAHLEARSYRRGAALLAQGDGVDWLGFLACGLVRIHHRAGEREVTLGFDCEERFIGAYDAYVQRGPSTIGLEALEPCVVWRFPRELLERLEARHAAWLALFRRMLERELLRKLDKELRLRTRTPAERYAELLRTGSYLVRRVPQYHLAAFLGITPETLSRIRARRVSAPRS